MAGRPSKVGLDYFELDCHMDEKVELIEAEYGLKGFAVVVKLYQGIYSGLGYYCEWTPDISVLWARRLGLTFGGDYGNVGNVYNEKCALSGYPKNLINDVVAASIRRNIFSEELFNKYHILTSSGIQKRYLNATSKREKVELKKEYLLFPIPQNSKNVVINSISDGINSISEVRNAQSKVEKRKVNKSNNIESASAPYKFVPPSVKEVEDYCRERGNKVNASAFVNFYDSKGWMVGRNRMKDWKAAVRRWESNSDNKGKPAYVNNNPFLQHRQNEIDYDALEEKLLES